MLKGLASDLTGAADICSPVRDVHKCLAFQYVLPDETILFALQSTKEEYAFTNQGMIRTEGESATTTRKLVQRFDYKPHAISSVAFESAGRMDRDCEIKFHIGGEHISIDIATSEMTEAIIYYKVLVLLAREQSSNNTKWEFATTAIGHAASAIRLGETSGASLAKQGDEAMGWLQDKYKHLQPRCYREFIVNAMQDVRTGNKLAEA